MALIFRRMVVVGVGLIGGSLALDARKRIGPLDLAKEQARYGAQTRGGVGISVPT